MTENSDEVLSTAVMLSSVGLSIICLSALLFVFPIEAALATALLAFAMALVTATDLRRFIIPDVVSLPAIPAGIVSNVLVFHSGDWWAGLTQSLLGAFIGASVFFLLRLFYRWARGAEGLGLGDVKLAAVAGAWLGPDPLADACLVAALSALAVVALRTLRKSVKQVSTRTVIPFGAFIAPVIFLFWVWRLLTNGLMT